MTHELSRRHIFQGAGALTFAGLLAAGFTPMAQAAETAAPSDLDALRERWVDQITGRKLIDLADPVFTAAVAAQDKAVAKSASLLNPRPGQLGIFTDAPFSAEAKIVTTYQRLAQMATAWATPGSKYLGDTTLLSQKLLRNDQVWFMEKDERGASRLYPLSDFSPRDNEAIERGYLNGRYGGIPFLKELDFYGLG